MKHMNGGGTSFGKFVPTKKDNGSAAKQHYKGYSVIQPAAEAEQTEDEVKAAIARQVQQALHKEVEPEVAAPVAPAAPAEPEPVAPAAPVVPEPVAPAAPVVPVVPAAPVVLSNSVIASDVVITGNIETKGNIEILGTHKGGIRAEGVVSVSGTVNGNIEAKELILKDCAVSAEQLIIGGKVAVVGSAKVTSDIACESIDIEATVVGNVRVAKKCTISSTAVIDGDIAAGSISVEEGAIVNSRIEITGM